MKIDEALQILRPNAEWVCYADSYSRLIWLDSIQSKPTEAEVVAQTNQ